MAEKVTIMVLKVDLQCSKCYKKVKRILCQFPQIRDQIYDEKSNTVTITVVCCSPEKIRDKLCRKGGGTIKSIDIKEPKKPEPPKPLPVVEKPKPKPDPPPVVVAPAPPEKPKEKPTVVVVPPPEKPKEKPPPPPPVIVQDRPPSPKTGYPLLGCPQYPDYCYLPYNEGPWHEQPQPQQPPCHAVCGGRSGRDAYGGVYSSSRCCDYFSEENPASCSVM